MKMTEKDGAKKSGGKWLESSLKIIKLIYKEGFNYIPVLNKNKKVVNIATQSSLTDFLQNK